MKWWPKYHFVLFAIMIISSFEFPVASTVLFSTSVISREATVMFITVKSPRKVNNISMEKISDVNEIS